jgi:serine/threonine-protein kinase
MASPPPQLGDALAPAYRIEREVGRGAAATVFLAHDVRHDRAVALKVLHPDFGLGVGTDRFLRETRIAARLTHPHILPVFDSGAAGGWVYYVMPYVAGGSLRGRLRRESRLPVGEALRIAGAAAAALDYAHRAGVVHRDIKPDNILLHDGEALVADFGIARAFEGFIGDDLTRTGFAVGTPAYMSPEQASGERDLDGRSDVYSLACTVYEMLAGSVPFAGRTPQAMMTKRLTEAPAPLRTLRPELDERVEAVVARALATSRDHRYATAAEFAQALAAAALRADPAPAAPTVVAERAPSATPASGWGRATPTPAGPKSVAVLAFDDLSAERDGEYFGDGMAEEVINALAYVPGLRVASRTSAFAFKGRREDVREIARQLGVGAVLEGTVRRAGARLRVSAQLTDAATGYQLWADRFDRDLDDVFAIQEELARTIVAALKIELAVADDVGLVRRYTDNLVAYDSYLRGRHHLSHITADGLGSAITLFERAVGEDPLQAPAHAALASACIAYAFYGDGAWRPRALWERARRAATAALNIDPALADAVGALGTTTLACDWDFVGAEGALRHAAELKPGDPLLHNWHGWSLLLLGQSAPALLALQRARDLDPLSPFAHRSVCRALYFEREHARAIAECHRVLAWAPRYYLVHVDLASALLATGRVAEAAATLEQARAIRPADTRILALSGYAAARAGDHPAAWQYLGALGELAADRYVTPVDPAIVLLGLGERDAAIGELEAAHAARDTWMPWLRCWPIFDDLRDDPRFPALLPGPG